MDGNSLKTSWVPWVIKDGRPRSVPGHQNTENLPHLPEGADDCGDDNDCFYYKCKKCISSLMSNILGIANREGEELVYVPEVKYIKPNKDEGLFTLDPGYHGEVTEFVARYLSRMENMTGVAFNGWSSKDAAKIFTNIDRTFVGTKHENSDNFEIDWLVFSGSNLFVIEVGMRELDKVCDIKGTEMLIHKKLSQSAAKNELIIRHLLEVTGLKPTDIYFLAVFPNIPFEDVQRKIRRVPEQKESLNKLVFPARFPCGVKFKFGVITSDVISEKSVYLYENDGNFCEPKHFESLLEPRVSENQKYAVSIVVVSMLLTGKPENTKKKQKKSPEELHLKQTSEICSPWDWSKNWPKNKAKEAVNYPKDTPRKKNGPPIKFPEELILGLEQTETIKSEKKHTIIIGQAGSGKTTVLLAVLYKYAGNHITGNKKLKKLKKVHFIIPESKTELRRKVQEFIDKHCKKKWAQLGSPDIIKSQLFCSENIYLIDEFYVNGVNYHEFPCWANVWLSHTSIDSDNSSDPLIDPTTKSSERQVVYFTRLYRSPPMISKVCAKISRKLDQRESKSNILSRLPWAMSRYDKIGNTFEKSLEIESYSEGIFIDKLELPDGETLIVGWKLDWKSKQKLKLQKPDATFYFLSSSSLTVNDLNFTGSEFKNVVIVLGEITDPISKSSLILFYNALSRTTEKAYVFCHATVFDQVKSLLELSDKDLVFDKQRGGDNLGKRLFGSTAEGLLPDPQDRVEAFKRACIFGKNIQSNAIVDFISELREIDPLMEASFRKQEKVVILKDVEKKGRCEKSKDGFCDEKGETDNLRKTDVEFQTTRDQDYERVDETQNRSESRDKNDENLSGPSQIRTNMNGSPDKKNEFPCRIDKTNESSSLAIPNDEFLNRFDPEHKELFRLASFGIDAIGRNQDLKSSLVDFTSSPQPLSFITQLKSIDGETLLRMTKELPATAENIAHFNSFGCLFHMVFSSMFPSEIKIPFLQLATSMTFGKNCKNEWTTLMNSLIESQSIDEQSKENLKNNAGELYDWTRQLMTFHNTMWASIENQNPSNLKQTAAEIINVIEYVDEEDALIEFLKERQLEIRDHYFQFILERMIFTKNIKVFGEWLQHLMKNQSIEFSNDLLLDEKKRNLLMNCAKSTEHFTKLIELVQGNDLSVLLYQEDENGHNCFTRACIYDNLEVVKILIEKFHYDWTFWEDSEGNTIINILCERDNIRILNYLFGGPVERIYQDKNLAMESAKMLNRKGWSFLSQICSTGNYNLLKFFMKGKELSLLQKIFPFPDYGRHYIDCLVLALTSEKQNIRVSKSLMTFVEEKILEFNLKIDDSSLMGTNGENILMVSVNCLETMVIFLSLAEAEDVQNGLLCLKDSRGNTCLRWACRFGNLDSVKLLLSYDNLDWKSDQNGKTLLHELCERGQFEILDYLFINYYEDFINVGKWLDSQFKSCLYYACSTGRSVACIALLIEILDTILPLPYYLSDFIDGLLAANESGSQDKEEILELLVKCFNQKMSKNCEDLDDVLIYYTNISTDIALD